MRAGLRPCPGRRAWCRRGARPGRGPAPARHPGDRQGVLQRGRAAHDLGHAAVPGLRTGRGRGPGVPAPGRRRGHTGQDECAVGAAGPAELQRDLRHHQQPLGSCAHVGRIVRWLGGCPGLRVRLVVHRLRHRWFAAHSCALLRCVRPQADARAGGGPRYGPADRAGVSGRPRARRRGPHGTYGPRPHAPPRRHGGAGSADVRRGSPDGAAARAPRSVERLPGPGPRRASVHRDRVCGARRCEPGGRRARRGRRPRGTAYSAAARSGRSRDALHPAAVLGLRRAFSRRGRTRSCGPAPPR